MLDGSTSPPLRMNSIKDANSQKCQFILQSSHFKSDIKINSKQSISTKSKSRNHQINPKRNNDTQASTSLTTTHKYGPRRTIRSKTNADIDSNNHSIISVNNTLSIFKSPFEGYNRYAYNNRLCFNLRFK